MKIFSAFIVSLCVLSTAWAVPQNELFQVSTIGALAQGVYDADFTYRDLMLHGSQGLGTFDGLAGEMVALDGRFYQIDPQGQVTEVSPDQQTPFAEVVNFHPTAQGHLAQLGSIAAVRAKLLAKLVPGNVPYAIRIHGRFKAMRLRSFAKQKKPYPPLLEASRHQAIFELDDVDGTLVGFWFPAYWLGIAVPGFHLHFISDDHTVGGHVLALDLDQGAWSSAPLYTQTLNLPSNQAFASVNLAPHELGASIKAAEE